MKTKLLFCATLLLLSISQMNGQNTFNSSPVVNTASSTSLEIKAPAVANTGEDLIKVGVIDAPNDFLKITNANAINTTFMPAIWGHNNSNLTALQSIGSIPIIGDNGSYPVVNFMAKTFTGGVSAAVVNRTAFQFNNFGTNLMTMAANGNIGIGTNAPIARLDIRGGDVALNDNRILFRPNDLKHGLGYKMTFAGRTIDGPALWGFAGGALGTNNYGAETIALSWNSAGNVAIGNTCIPGDYRLAVKGKIICEELLVKLEGGNCWADFVFDKEYKLKTLSEVEQYINKNHHLPNVPSAVEVKEIGISTSEMFKIQMEKIEELTLYLIEINKVNETLKTRINELEKMNTK